ncbi:ghmp n-terminal domain-containing protein, partial [Cystoisospora suis]
MSLCKSQDDPSSSSTSLHDKLQRLGCLMRASHESCSENFECACEESNRLVEYSMQNGGARASRMTGA